MINFEDILLEEVQEGLLIQLVDLTRDYPNVKNAKFMVSQTFGGDSLIHPYLPENNRPKVYLGNIEVLAEAGLLTLGYSPNGTPNFDVTPLGYRYYDYLKKQMGTPIERVEKTVRNFLNASQFQHNYPTAFEKWTKAEELLWQPDAQQHFSTIGHLCREAAQEFADALVNIHQPTDVSSDKTKTVARLQSVVKMKFQNEHKTKRAYLDALIAYWGTVNDLIQRQEHLSEKEGQPVVVEDARLVVFQTLIVMFEIDRALSIG